MADIVERSIIRLLRSNDCVIVPGMGGFVMNTKPATFTGKHEINPPSRELGFNSGIAQERDDLLVSAIASETKIEQDEALQRINDTVQEWKDILSTEGYLKLNGLGALTLAPDKKWSFEAEPQHPFMLSSYGLGSVQLLPLSRSQAQIAQQQKVRAIGGLAVKYKKALITGLSAAALLTLGLFAGQRFLQNAPDEKLYAEKTVVEKDSPMTALNRIINDEQLAPEKAGILSNLDYYVIGGSFSKKANAERFVSELKSKGFSAEILNNESGFFRVAYLKEKDSTSADQHLQKIKLEENQAAWILKW